MTKKKSSSKKKSASKKSAHGAGGMHRVDLGEVAERAMHDRDFFEALKDDPEAALQEVGWSLSQQDLEALTEALEANLVAVPFNAVEYIEDQLDHPECARGWADPAWKRWLPPHRR